MIVTVVIRLPDGNCFHYANSIPDATCMADVYFDRLDDDAVEIAYNLLALASADQMQLERQLRYLDTDVPGISKLTGGVQVLILHNTCDFPAQ